MYTQFNNQWLTISVTGKGSYHSLWICVRFTIIITTVIIIRSGSGTISLTTITIYVIVIIADFLTHRMHLQLLSIAEDVHPVIILKWSLRKGHIDVLLTFYQISRRGNVAGAGVVVTSDKGRSLRQWHKHLNITLPWCKVVCKESSMQTWTTLIIIVIIDRISCVLCTAE